MIGHSSFNLSYVWRNSSILAKNGGSRMWSPSIDLSSVTYRKVNLDILNFFHILTSAGEQEYSRTCSLHGDKDI